MPDITFIPLNEVKKRTTLSTTTIYRFIAAGKFPKSVNLLGRRVAWKEAEVQDWIDERTLNVKQIAKDNKAVWVTSTLGDALTNPINNSKENCDD